VASHFGRVQTLLSDGKGGFTEKVLRGTDGYAAAQLSDLNGDGHLDLILLGYLKSGIEIYFGDGKGNWTLHTTLPQPRPGQLFQVVTLLSEISITTATWTWWQRFSAGVVYVRGLPVIHSVTLEDLEGGRRA